MKTKFIDTHCHLNFKRFEKSREQVIQNAHHNGVGVCIVPGTDIKSSQKAVELATHDKTIYAAVGIHPHHTLENSKIKIRNSKNEKLKDDIEELEKLITHPKVVAVGEVGLDRHEYEETKYPDYEINDAFMEIQKEYFTMQIRLAKQYGKALIIHNRETKQDMLVILSREWNKDMNFHTVFHCCEPDEELLEYAVAHDIYVGVDGDVTYGGEKAAFLRKIPLDILVLETDSPFLLPEPLRTQKLYPNTPSTIPLIAQYIADIKGTSLEEIAEVTTHNAKRLFGI